MGKVKSAKKFLTTVGSMAATVVVAQSVIREFLPNEVKQYIYSSLYSFFSRRFLSDFTMVIQEFEDLESNKIFEAAKVYIGARARVMSTASPSSTRLRVLKHESENQILVNVDKNEEIIDEFNGIKFRWMLDCTQRVTNNPHSRVEIRAFHLNFNRRYKDFALETYLPYILEEAELIKQGTKTIKLFTVDDPEAGLYCPAEAWCSVGLNHPATFETVALDSEVKKVIIEDLERFVQRKDYYRRVGKAWKRGYLLYGPPGTGKSSLIAAMANYLNFDIYDLQLGGLKNDVELRTVLLGTTNKSILVVEDIDCTVKLKNRDEDDDEDDEDDGGGSGGGDGSSATDKSGKKKKQQGKVTLSGLLNFIDGLWSSCGDERIIVFTTNEKNKLDPALLRPGRMDMHIHMSYCTPCSFKILAKNYLDIEHHELFTEIERLIEEVKVTPAEVAEQLIKKNGHDSALSGLVEFLELKKLENDKTKTKISEDDESKPKDTDNKNHIKDDENEGNDILEDESKPKDTDNKNHIKDDENEGIDISEDDESKPKDTDNKNNIKDDEDKGNDISEDDESKLTKLVEMLKNLS